MKAALIALLIAVAPAHVTLGPVVLPVGWLLLAAEILTAAGGIWLAVRVARRFRSSPYPRLAGGRS